MKIALIAALSGALLAVGAQALPSAIGSSEDATDALVKPAASRTTEDAGARREDRRADRRKDRREHRRDDRRTGGATGVDISGPCDEAEHANDPRCTGVQAPSGQRREDDGGVDDISGPCDEAEHANDPRCTGVSPGLQGRDDDRDDHRFGHDDRGGDDDRDDNSGPGSDSSGHGSGGDDDDGGDDHSGSGHGGDDD